MNYVVKKYVGDQVINVFFDTQEKAQKEHSRLKKCGVKTLIMRNAL